MRLYSRFGHRDPEHGSDAPQFQRLELQFVLIFLSSEWVPQKKIACFILILLLCSCGLLKIAQFELCYNQILIIRWV